MNNSTNDIIVSWMQSKDDFMFEVERWLDTEQLYKRIYFSGYFPTNEADSVHDSDSRPNVSNISDEISRRILDILRAAKTGAVLQDLYEKMNDFDRQSVEEQVSSMTLEGLVYTNHGKLYLL